MTRADEYCAQLRNENRILLAQLECAKEQAATSMLLCTDHQALIVKHLALQNSTCACRYDVDSVTIVQQCEIHASWATELMEQSGFRRERDTLTKRVAELESTTGWIPASERLPTEDQGTVAVRMNDQSILTAWATYWHGSSTKFAQWTFPVDVDDAVVTHWFPLPEGF
jgi:hypothetical protein